MKDTVLSFCFFVLTFAALWWLFIFIESTPSLERLNYVRPTVVTICCSSIGIGFSFAIAMWTGVRQVFRMVKNWYTKRLIKKQKIENKKVVQTILGRKIKFPPKEQ